MTPTSAIAATPSPMTDVKCACKVCKRNAATLGVATPLRATVPVRMLDQCKGKAHGLVYIAHEPGPVGDRLRLQSGIRPL